MSQINIGLKTITPSEYKTIIESLQLQLNISYIQAFYPLFNKLDDSIALDDESNDSCTEYNLIYVFLQF